MTSGPVTGVMAMSELRATGESATQERPMVSAASERAWSSAPRTYGVRPLAAIPTRESAALTGSQQCVSEMRGDFLKLRDRVLAGLKTIPGISCSVPQGAFYVYPNVSAFFGKGGLKTASDVAAKLLSDARVVVVPGEAFGTAEHIRISYAVTADVVDEGVKRMREYFGQLS